MVGDEPRLEDQLLSRAIVGRRRSKEPYSYYGRATACFVVGIAIVGIAPSWRYTAWP